ncbi:hypothetical protein [Rhizobium sp. 768_B6_N1_8]|uniref:hypothetical protein n=1 Tax=unclassified Rhizobium TaxID=2613769 RepID=UPI003F292B56
MLSIQANVVDYTKRIGAIVCAVGLSCGPACAQISPDQSDRCQAPDQQQDQVPVPKDGNSRSANKSDAEQLADCNGVLKPPSTGDRDLVKPAPPVGETPVIPPDEFPQKQQ